IFSPRFSDWLAVGWEMPGLNVFPHLRRFHVPSALFSSIASKNKTILPCQISGSSFFMAI
ncbi:MAG: hypothetical protein KKE59_02365, partial [Proteobacteria bacterium]|nr:hypothetical protein [Pseudomonadota bacterium]